MAASSLPLLQVMVAVLLMGPSTPSSSTQLPARARLSSRRKRPCGTESEVTVHTAMSSSSCSV